MRVVMMVLVLLALVVGACARPDPSPPVTAIVLQVEGTSQSALVQINAGSNHGVQVGWHASFVASGRRIPGGKIIRVDTKRAWFRTSRPVAFVTKHPDVELRP